MPLLGWPLISVGGSVLGFCPCALFLTSLVHGLSPVLWAPCFPPAVALAAGFLGFSCLNAPRVVTARQASCSEVPIYHPFERCCPPGLGTKHMPEGSSWQWTRVAQLRQEMALPAPREAGQQGRLGLWPSQGVRSDEPFLRV